jgi:hypothetical protein
MAGDHRNSAGPIRLFCAMKSCDRAPLAASRVDEPRRGRQRQPPEPFPEFGQVRTRALAKSWPGLRRRLPRLAPRRCVRSSRARALLA